MFIDHQSALGAKERRHHSGVPKRALQRCNAEIGPPEGVGGLARCGAGVVGQCGLEDFGIDRQLGSELGNIGRLLCAAIVEDLLEPGLHRCDVVDALVEDGIGESILRKDGGGKTGVADGFVPEAPTPAIDNHAAFFDGGP